MIMMEMAIKDLHDSGVFLVSLKGDKPATIPSLLVESLRLASVSKLDNLVLTPLLKLIPVFFKILNLDFQLF